MPDLSLNSRERSASRVRDQQGRRFLNYLPISYSTLVKRYIGLRKKRPPSRSGIEDPANEKRQNESRSITK